MGYRGLRIVAGAWLAASSGLGFGAAPTAADIARICANAEGPAHCGRLIEEAQLKALPNLARRDGDTLVVSLFPTGQRSFADTVSAASEKSYALFDYWSPINAVVLLVHADDDASFAILQRANGQVTAVPAEPVLAPDRQRLVVADFCARCTNELSVWRVSRDGIRKDLGWKPQPAWRDASAKWKDGETLIVEYTPADGAESRTLERKLAASDWRRP